MWMYAIVFCFIIYWFGEFVDQFRNPKVKIKNRTKHISEYIFFSNTIRRFPKGLIVFLFLNCKMTVLPAITVISQALNYVILFLSLIMKYVFVTTTDEVYITICIVWACKFLLFSIAKLIDFEIYIRKHDFLN